MELSDGKPTGPERRRGIDTSLGQSGRCEKCGIWKEEGPDACLGIIPGASHACCGHGDIARAYVCLGGAPDQPAYLIDETVVLRGEDALDFFEAVNRARQIGETTKAEERAP